MSREEVQVTAYTCDGCGKRFVCEAGEEADGFHGTAYQSGSWGVAAVAEWFACKSACIKKAVTEALEKASERA